MEARSKDFNKGLIEILSQVTALLQFDYDLIESECFINNISSVSLKLECLIMDAKRKNNV